MGLNGGKGGKGSKKRYVFDNLSIFTLPTHKTKPHISTVKSINTPLTTTEGQGPVEPNKDEEVVRSKLHTVLCG